MRTEFVYKPSFLSGALSEMDINKLKTKSIKIQEKNNVRTIIFHDQTQFQLAKKSKDFLEDFFDFYGSNRLEKHRIMFGGKQFQATVFFDTALLNYLNNYSYTEKKEIINSLVRLSGKYSEIELANKFSVFLINLKKLSKAYAKDGLHKSIFPALRSLYSNTIPREPHIMEFNRACKETYAGFIRAIRSGTITTDKVIVNGKEIRMFFKSLAGSTGTDILTKRENKALRSKDEIDLMQGYKELAIDPKTLEIYAIRTKGRIHFGTPAEKLPGHWLSQKNEKHLKELVKTELESHLNKVYAKKNAKGKIEVPGIQRMKETHRRMSSKAR